MNMIKRLWKRGTRRHPSPNTVDDRHSGSSRPDDAPTMPSAASSSSSLAGAVEGAPLAAQQQQQQQRQQEALIAAMQSTVLEQRRRLEGLDATVARLHNEARRQGFHVEALQRLLHQLTAADQSAEEQEGLEGANAAVSSLSSSSTTSLRLLGGLAEEAQPRRLAGGLAATPPMWGPGAATAAAGGATVADMPAEGEEEGGGLYSYISGFWGGAASTLLLPAAAAGGASEGQGDEEQQVHSEVQQPSKSVQIADTAAYGRLTPAGGRTKMDLEDAQALLMSQILEKLHLAEDRYHFQAEEIHALQAQLREREEECLRLRAERARHALLLHGLKRELSAYRHKLRDRDVKEANLEVEIDRYRLEKRSLTRLMSEAASATIDGPLTLPPPTPSAFSFGPGSHTHGGPGSAPPTYAGGDLELALPTHAMEAFPLSPPPSSSSPRPYQQQQQQNVASSLQQLDRMIGESGGAPAAPSPPPPATTPRKPSPPQQQQPHQQQHATPPVGPRASWGTPTPDSAAQHIGQLRVEVAALHAELEAARAVSEAEVRKRVAAEHEARTLGRQLRETQVLLQAEEVGDGGEGDGGEGKGEEVKGEGEEMAALVLKEQLSSLRDLKPAFHASYGAATTEFKVRGPSYLADGVKVTDAPPPLFELVHMELLDVSTHPDHGGPQTPSRADHVTQLFHARGADGPYARCRTLASAPPPFLLVLNFQVPGNPPCSMMAYFALAGPRRRRLEALQARLQRRGGDGVGRDVAKTQGGEGLVVDEDGDEEEGEQGAGAGFSFPPPPQQLAVEGGEGEEEAAETEAEGIDAREEKALRLLAAFLEGDDAYRNARFKLIPSVVEGPFLIRMSVGNKPVLLGTKLTQRYWSGPGYLEVGIDIGSSSVASSVLGLVRDYSRNIVVEIAVLVQGENEEELPERLLGSVRCSRLDWSLAESLADRLVPSPPNSGASAASLSSSLA